MSYVNRVGDEIIPSESVVTGRVTEYRDRVRWGPIISGILVALATQLILSSFFGAIGVSRIADFLGATTIVVGIISNVGIWSTISLLISLFLGGWVTTRACGPMHRDTALLNGAILWAATLAISSFLLANGVWGTFGIAAYNVVEVINQVRQQGANIPENLPPLTAEQTIEIAAAISRILWWFVFGALLGLLAALIGAFTGARSPRTNNNNH
ncbi:hypothetical protein WJM97_19620 [Okeanomitos corallinicola TIOX110]|uniref:DUF4199 domain-containing protein n=1 Tax=Okeanomitos corallinicola TIOX110 TaxID=3133117 RepID=A0ABZ2URE2_9CYAN